MEYGVWGKMPGLKYNCAMPYAPCAMQQLKFAKLFD